MELEFQNIVKEQRLFECMQCGVCTGSCPVFPKSRLNIRRIIRRMPLFGEISIPPENELWSCTTCSTCEIRCPKKLSPVSVIIAMRSMVVESGKIAPTLRDALESIYKYGNPWGRIKSKRSEWAQDLKVKHISEGAEFLYFVGCTASYDPRVQEVARSLVSIFNLVKADFGILGNEEGCCGDPAYGIGEIGLFEFLVEENMKIFNKYDVSQIVTTSPHCYHNFKNRYGETSFEVQHYTQYLSNLIDAGKLKFSRRIEKKITYHDPCFLGKQNNIYDEPRRVLEEIPGVRLVEMDRSRQKSLCCEGGGGRMWIDIPGQRLAEIRVKEAIETGAEILATACPFCLLNLEDAVKTAGYEGKIQVLDISEIVSKAI